MIGDKHDALTLADALCEVRRLDAEQRLLREARERDNVSFKQLLAQRDALLEALRLARLMLIAHGERHAKIDAAIRAVEGEKS